MKKTTRRILIALTLTVILVLSITGAVLAAGPHNGGGGGNGACVNDGVCPNEGTCPNEGVCPNDCDGDRSQTRAQAQTCNGTAHQFRHGNSLNEEGTDSTYQYARMWRHMFGVEVEG